MSESLDTVASDRPVTAPNSMQGSNNPPNDHGTRRSYNHTPNEVYQVDEEAAAIKLEMMRLKERRRILEERRNLLQNPTRHRTDGSASVGGLSMGSSFGRQSPGARTSSSVPLYDTPHDPPGATHIEPIYDEQSRRSHFAHATLQSDMKEQIRDSWQRDTTLLQGFFLPQYSSAKASTFGRAPRFQKPLGMCGPYYLSSEMQRLQAQSTRKKSTHLTVASRGQVGTNVNSNWSDVKGGIAPGPGAYTPRYGAASKGLTVPRR